MEKPQERMPMLPLKNRLRGFAEVELGYTNEQATRESCRCLRCDIRIDENGAEPIEPIAEARN